MGNICSNPNNLSKISTKTLKICELERANPIKEEDKCQTQMDKSFEFKIGELEITSDHLRRIGLNTLELGKIKLSSKDGLSFIILNRLKSKDELNSFSNSSKFFESNKNPNSKNSKNSKISKNPNSKNFSETSEISNSKEISSIKKRPKNKSSKFKKEISKKNFEFEEIFRKKLLASMQFEYFSNMELIHLNELMIPFPEENDLDKIQNDEYLNKCIKEINEKFDGKLFVNKFHMNITSKENVIEFISYKDNEDKINESFYFEENCYIGINIKIINDNTYVVYFLYAFEEAR